MNISRNIFPIAKSFRCLDAWDLSCNSYVDWTRTYGLLRGKRKYHSWQSYLGEEFFVFIGFWIHTASTPVTSGTYTDGGAVIRKPGSAWLEGTPAISIIFTFCFMIIPFFGLFEAATQLARQVHQERTQVVYSNKPKVDRKVHQERTQVVYSNKVDRSRLALRHSRY